MRPLPGKRERNKRARKEALYQAALELFRRQGFDATRVEEITHAAGLAKGTFFNYFPNKEAVLLYISERHLSRLGAALVQEEGETPPPAPFGLAALKRMLHALAHSVEADRDLIRLAVNRAMTIAYLAPQRAGGRATFSELAAILIQQAQRRGEIRPDLSPDSVAALLEGLYYQQLAIWCQQDFNFDLGQRLEAMVDLLVRGIGSQDRDTRQAGCGRDPGH